MTNMTNATKKRIALTGGAAAAEALRQINPDVMAVYPITPQTTIIEAYAKLAADGLVNTEVIQVESEHSAMSACIGASAAGARSVTATSSQGLLLMHEMLYIASGLRLPILMVDSARAVSSPINIHGDHSDVMGVRDSGWIQIFSENAQEVYDNTVMGMKLAEKVSLPVMVIMDGFNTSHSVENLETADTKKVRKFIGEYRPEQTLLKTNQPVTFGPLALQNSYFEFKIDQEKAMMSVADCYADITADFAEISGRRYNFFESYKLKDAEYIIVLAGSAAGTAKDVVDKLRQNGKKVGLLKINLFRPFPSAEIAEALKNAKSIAVLDRAQSIGTMPPFYMEIINSLNATKYKIQTASYIYGLGGRDIFAKDIEKVFMDLIKNKFSKEIKYIQ
ncbi:MAG: pyruvate ferredoxin oxidoreductase [Candidatus Moranbacteria bacterium]|nr:pyruvate ferredoxin oxidoreductase [Candidatus Moranbacteria bacterium]